MEDFSASLLDGRLIFGKYPKQSEVGLLFAGGISHIVNLCTKEEIEGWSSDDRYSIPIESKICYLEYPFEDGRKQVPVEGWDSFPIFIATLIDILSADRENILYLHCKGGHGRSATISAIVYGKIMKISSKEAIDAVYQAHQKRKVMSDDPEKSAKWRKLGAPQREKQKEIVKKYLAIQ